MVLLTLFIYWLMSVCLVDTIKDTHEYLKDQEAKNRAKRQKEEEEKQRRAKEAAEETKKGGKL